MAKTKLPIGVIAVKNRAGLYRFRVTIAGKLYSEYYSLDNDDTLKQAERNSILQKTIDEYRQKCERGTVKGDITDRNTFSQAVEWYLSISTNRESTILNRQRTLNAYVIPDIGNVQVKKITPAMLSSLFADLHANGSKKTTYTPRSDFIKVVQADAKGRITQTATAIGIGQKRFQHLRNGTAVEKKTAELVSNYYKTSVNKAFTVETTAEPLSARTIDHIANSISAVFTKLINNDVVNYNPVSKAEKPEIGEYDPGTFLDNETIPIFQKALTTIDNADIRVLLTLCLEVGLRNGEARALSWQHIDFSKRVINIRNSITKNKQGKEVIGLTKTKRSRRQLPLSPSLSALLVEHKARQDKINSERGTAYNNKHNLVATNTAGNHMQLSALTHYMKQIRESNPELPDDLHTHSLRHTFCSLLISQGYNVVLVAALMGDTVEMILEVYAHSFKALEVKAMTELATVFSFSSESQALLV